MARLLELGLTELYCILRNVTRCAANAKYPVIEVAGVRDMLSVIRGTYLVEYLGASI